MTPFQILLLTMSVVVIFFKTGNCADKTPPVCESVNVKTVLWRQIDTCRKCWGKQDVLKAYARRVVQDLLPRRVPKNIPMLLQYLTTIWEQVPKSTPDNSIERYILTVALADVIGGYLQSVALPIANEAYYAGNVDYKVMAQLYFLFEEVKMELGTDGGGWSKPCDMKRIPTKVSGLDLSSVGDKGNREACRDLHIPVEETNIEDNEFKQQKALTNETHPGHPVQGAAPPSQQCLPKTTEPPKKELKIPMPFLDDDQRPNAIAVPFKDQLLYSLHCMGSAHILVRYYMTALRCIGKKDKQALMKFNCAFYNWIIINVIPHLHEKNKWYTGFGSVMRIIETMHQKGWSPQPDIAAGMNNGGQPGGRGGCQARQSLPETVPTMPAHEAPKEVEFPSEKLIKLLEILGLALLGLIVFLLVCCCCIRLLTSRDNQFKPLLSIYYKMTGQDEKEPAGKGGKKGGKYRDYDETCATLNTERDSEFSMKYADTDETTSATSETEERVPKKCSKN